MGRQRFPKRWNSKFARFVERYGVARIATELHIDPTAIYHWIRAVTRPKPELAAIIQRIAGQHGTKLTLDDIYGHSANLRSADPSIAVQIERKKVSRALR